MQQNKIAPLLMMITLLAAACTPTVKVEAPDKPIEINMNIKIEQEVRVKVDKDLDDVFANDPELFGSTAAQKKEVKKQ
jgi:hypothetical protein